MNKQLRTMLIIFGAVFILWLIIILPGRIEYLNSEDYQYDRKCSELEKQLKETYGDYLGEMKVSFSTEDNLLTVAFYERSYYFDQAYYCKKSVEDYINSNSGFFVNQLESYVEVQSKNNPYMDYEREMYIYRGKAENGLALDELVYNTDSYFIWKAFKTETDIRTLTVRSYGDVTSALEVIAQSPQLERVCFKEKYRQPDGEQLKALEEAVGENCIIELYDENNDKGE
ncbi:MAG: hypothetical protein IJ007_03655 [Oscillospiraceae bacterium]|nr:hypothetical protein [Oscillospiraceae bacterium]